MASVHRRPGSKFYQAAWRDRDGKSFQRSTKTADHNEAMMMAIEWQLFARCEHPTEAQGRDVVNDILRRSGVSTLEIITTADHFNGWLEGKRMNKSDGTYQKYKTAVTRFLESMGKDSQLPLKNVTVRHVEAFVAARLAEGLAATTVNQNLKTVRSVLKAACKNGQLPFNPADNVEAPKGEAVERGTFSSGDIQLLLDSSKGEWGTLIMVAYFTGARLSDCVKMCWTGTRKNRQQTEGVDLTTETLTYWNQKNRKLITVPIHPELLALLDDMASSDQVNQFIMPGMAKMGPGGRHGLSEGFKRVMKRAGLDLERVESKGKRQLSRRTFHALRHTFNSALANAGVDQKLRMALTGHKTEAINDIYTHHGMKTMREAILKYPGLKGGKE